jgi:predicted metal-dependent phosphoesterase TrpH/glycosyltransferase involved in cell wall biosynthesis
VNVFVRRVSEELAARGHRVVIVAPSDSRELIARSRALVAGAARDPDGLFAVAEPGRPSVVAVGPALPMAATRGRDGRSLPLDVSRTIEELLDRVPFDFVHVHEPWAPSASSAALRHSRALNVATFHSATERIVSTQVARSLVALIFGRLDGRTASFGITRDRVERFFPGDYRLVLPGADALTAPRSPGDGPVEIVYAADEERPALRLLLRSLRHLPEGLDWRLTVWSRAGAADPTVPLGRALRGRVVFAGPEHGTQDEHLARADLAVAATTGGAPSPQVLLRAMAAGAVPVASRVGEYEEVLSEGERGPLFEPRDAQTLAAQLERLLRDPALREAYRRRIAEGRRAMSWERVADEVEDVYRRIAARRFDPSRDRALRRSLRSRPFVHVDLHMHTNHSPDCATPVRTLLETAKARGLDAIAVTDHNVISGALEARERANGIKVIVAEEVKTADQGEVIGLFIEEHIPRGMTLQDTIAEIRRQGGLVYVPHPFDRLHAVPDYEHLLQVVEDIDALEVFNPRVAISAFNEEAERFAAKYRLAAGAGSDSHVAQGLGSVKIRMRDFDGAEEFLASLRDADIIRKRQSLLYVQALKFLQTTGAARPPRVKVGGNK